MGLLMESACINLIVSWLKIYLKEVYFVECSEMSSIVCVFVSLCHCSYDPCGDLGNVHYLWGSKCFSPLVTQVPRGLGTTDET